MNRKKMFTPTAALIAIIYLLFGLMLVIWPDTSMLTICRTAGGVLCLLGVISCAVYFRQDRYLAATGHRLTMGLVALVLGSFVFLRPSIVADVTPVLIGILLTLDSAGRIQNAIDLYRLCGAHWQLPLAAGLLTAIFGIVLMNRPFDSVVALTIFIGVCLILNGFGLLLSGFLLNRINPFPPDEDQ